jgi:hypothetical protein
LVEGLEHAVEVADDVVVPEAEYSVIQGGQGCSAFLIDALVVLTAVDLDDKIRVSTQKIDDVGSYRDLTPELEPVQPAITDRKPDCPFCIRHLSPKRSGMRADPPHCSAFLLLLPRAGEGRFA